MSVQRFELDEQAQAASLFSKIWPGALAAQAIYCAAKLNLPDLIGGSAKSADEIAAECATNPVALGRFL